MNDQLVDVVSGKQRAVYTKEASMMLSQMDALLHCAEELADGRTQIIVADVHDLLHQLAACLVDNEILLCEKPA